jgi:hypothetical protein
MNPETIANVIEGALQLVGFCSVIAVFTPTPVDNAVLGVLKRCLDFAAMNWGHARNKDAA